jgi:hypothetical protein
LFALGGGMALGLSGPSVAAQQAPTDNGALAANAPTDNDALGADAPLDIAPEPPEGRTHDDHSAAPDEPPPMRPRHRGLVLETTLGVLGFAGDFRHVAPPAYWIHGEVGYEVLRWLMVFGESELALTDSGESQDESHTMAFPMWGFGGGVRTTVHATERVAFTVQVGVDEFAADVPHDSLTILGFRNAETLNLSYGGRVGAEWYQPDRHFAFLLALGGRDATGFARVAGGPDLPLMWDFGVGLRYVF